ncbi:ATP-binding protein [Pararhizobium sp. BT-229]|uniref:ATP-binding protein n=1 Tax=Pararhizobium sp. BT-229 TaxID=2986923 RepID=UPI0021F7500F|nr:ATP-binding protein [Pararhizobium sp. BT-229]MCV9961743.1 ATP-binding protein [Pararhizobium sp. BT-229]
MHGKPTIRVAIVRSQDDLLAELIESEVRASSDFLLVASELIAPEDVECRLRAVADLTDVLIAIGDFDARLMEHIIQLDAGTVMFGILIGSDTVSVRLKKVGVRQLMETLAALSRDRDRVSPQFVGYEFIEGDRAGGGAYQFIDLRRTEDCVLHAAGNWVRQALLSYWRRLPKTEVDVLGHARSPDAIQDLLGRVSTLSRSEADQSAFAKLCSLLKEEGAGAQSPLARLLHGLGLEEIEFKLLLLALAPELDINIQIAFGLLNDDLGRKTPTFGLACAVLGRPIEVRNAIETAGSLFRWRLLENGSASPHADDAIRLSPCVNSWLLGNRTALLDAAAVRQFIRSAVYPGIGLTEAVEGRSAARDLAGWFGREHEGWIIPSNVHLDRWRARCELAAAESTVSLLRCQPTSMLTLSRELQREASIAIARAARLMGGVAVVDFGDEPADEARSMLVKNLVEAFSGQPRPAVLIASDVASYISALGASTIVSVRLPDDTEAELSAIYAAAADRAGMSLTAKECDRLALAFKLPLDGIEEAMTLAALDGRRPGASGENYERVASACRRIASPKLTQLAQRMEPAFSLDQLILPAEQHMQLREVVSNVTNATTVLKKWGFEAQLPYGSGVVALFSGPSGTGKTMAAQAIARELRTEVFAVDLSRVVSKYIGETEKNLDAVFTEAERANALLLINEAECTVSQRAEQKDAHDRYANLEIAYLLQRMESFSGLAILTTNFKQNIDRAFLRRLRFVIDFPKPDARAREAIWRQCLPSAAPIGPGVDFSFLARQVELTGGNIRQITLRAAFAAANEGGAIEMRHIFAATRAELLKLGANGAMRELAEVETFHANDRAA